MNSARAQAKHAAGPGSLPSWLVRGRGGVHLDDLHHGGGFDVGESVKGGLSVSNVLKENAVVGEEQ